MRNKINTKVNFRKNHICFDNSFVNLGDKFYAKLNPTPVEKPEMIKLNDKLASNLGIELEMLDLQDWASIFSGNRILPGAEPLAMVYAGHQFGHLVPQLGDGRAILLGEVIDNFSIRNDIQLKGSGRTPFSRGGDGKAALGPVLREYLIAEGMHALGISTTRALAAVSTGENVYREIPLPGAILTRVAASHIRVGTFQYGAARGEVDKVRALADYTILRHYPEIADAENPYLEFFVAVTDSQAALVASWMNIGFIHGVMNTDNMTISGETIDYGPCAFMNRYSPGTVFSSIDQHGRYAYANQPEILVWNLARLAETLIPFVDPDKNRAIELLTETIDCIKPLYESHWLAGMKSKIGLSTKGSQDEQLITDLLSTMEEGQADFTLVFRRLAQVLRGESGAVRNLFKDPGAFDLWVQRWQKRLEQEGVSKEAIAESMNRFNPIYIPRNHKVEEALSAAVEQGDMKPFTKMLNVLSHPFIDIQEEEVYAKPPPQSNIPYRTFCGT